MPKSLIIVESPAKARTISRFLGRNFTVESSYGHVRDLPKSKLGVDVENNFEPAYLIPRKAQAVVKKLKSEAEPAEKIILATDEDREGEAIAWHLISALGLEDKPGDKIERIVFHEITENAVRKALENPRDLDLKRVNAQQARRILDRLVGYKLSPFLWKKVYRGLSAGRVQSVAVRLIVEREREIEKFKPQEYWTIVARLAQRGAKRTSFDAELVKIGEKKLEKFSIADKNRADDIVDALRRREWSAARIEKKTILRRPLPPFTTSTLQQAGFSRLGFSAKRTMALAQKLYEGVELGGEGSVGLITYMRTDSLNLSEESLAAASSYLKKSFGGSYALPHPRRFKTKSKGAQEAHEAIRPTDSFRTPDSVREFLDPGEGKLYDLIWRRFLASQMPDAVFDGTILDILAESKKQDNEPYWFRANGQIMRFDGFLKLYPFSFLEKELPELAEDERLDCKKIIPVPHFTEPPPRYSEASLIKALELHGIGRPSTYAPIISTIQERRYVERNTAKRLIPTETGCLVNDLLVAHFPEIVDVQFTAKMEEELDEVASGEKEWQPVIREFYEPFSKHLAQKYESVDKVSVEEKTEESCEKCARPMVVRRGRFGKFLACSGFPECKNTKPLKREPQTVGLACPGCGKGEVLVRRTKTGRIFYGCSRYPECDYASWQNPVQRPS
jgi:DNA topoisomerase-1